MGYVLEREKKELEQAGQDDDEMTLEEIIEEERANLNTDDLTPVTKDTFFAWKKRKAEEKQRELEEKMKEESKKPSGKNIMNGRALFTYNPDLFEDDDNAADEQTYEETQEEGDEERKEEEKVEENIDKDLF